jgi:hypothetical protein
MLEIHRFSHRIGPLLKQDPFFVFNPSWFFVLSIGGLMQFNYGNPQPLQYVASAAFLSAIYADYMTASDVPGWNCGPDFMPKETLWNFAQSQVR